MHEKMNRLSSVGKFEDILRATVWVALWLALSMVLTASTERPEQGEESVRPESSFVRVEEGRFTLGGEPFRFAGTNAYYLPNYEKLDPTVVDRAFHTFKAARITVVRTWAFYDGYDCGYSQHDVSENVIQVRPGVYSEEALRNLDMVIARGKRQNLRFILPLINYWDELGGICQYNTWAGADDPSGNMAFFLSNDQTQVWFRAYVEMLLNRVNRFTGVAYKDEPAILSWQIMNEGRNPGQPPEVLRDWYREMAVFIKSIAPDQLVGTGEEGFDEETLEVYSADMYSNTYVLRAKEGSSYLLNTAIPEIDYGNAHWYPTEYGFGYDVDEPLLISQRAWLQDHKAIADSVGKPMVLGEYGFPGWGDARVETVYAALWRDVTELNIDGSLIWQLTADYVKCTESGGNICWPGGRNDENLFKSYMGFVDDSNRR